MSLIAETAERVTAHTDPAQTRRIRATTERRVAAMRGDAAAIQARLAELDREWDIERMIEAQSSSLILAGTALGLGVHRGFFAIPLTVAAFLLQHAVQGWCPPLPLLRRLGFRTEREIEEERERLLDTLGGLS